ncbi:SPRY domain-containing protein 7 [Daktulosphaira vitifoliae]|uniref:SPRY domain-containing protein 7 n=1 Tax=Daktulosphaira vitifoliae TaxID=58002 RepID=UPI0021AAB065|nr:SPRY domain-containing protein 7 [Daktulosphaira vitifoliae]
MASVISCFKRCFDSLKYTEHIANLDLNSISLDTSRMGNEVVIVKNGTRICGSGGVLCSAPLVQNKSYFEVKVQQSGIWGVGLASYDVDLSKAPGGHDQYSWVLCNDGAQRHSQQVIKAIDNNINEGDIISVFYDHVELNYSINGLPVNEPITGIRGTVYPALFVDDGAILDIILEKFSYPPSNGYDKIMLEQSIL